MTSEQSDAAVSRKMTMDSIWERLRVELPPFPERQDAIRLPEPPASKIPELIQQPQTVDEMNEEYEKAKEKALAKAKANEKKSFQGGRRMSYFDGGPSAAAKEVAVKRKKPTSLKAWHASREIPYGETCWYGKRPQEPKLIIPSEYQRERRVVQLELLEKNLQAHNHRMAKLSGPVTGWVLRMNLISEPLRAPPCPESDEILTLIETALTSRRLRNYDIAISLLIKARRLWAARAAARNVPSAWVDVQPFVPAPSPWDALEGVEFQDAPQAVASSSSCRKKHVLSGKITDETLTVNCACSVESAQQSRSREAILCMPSGHADQLGTMASTSPEVLNSALDLTICASDLRRDARELASTAESPLPHSARASTVSRQANTITGEGRAVNLDDIGLGAPAIASERIYDPRLHFARACGDDDENMRHLVPEVNLFFLCELASLHSAIHEDDFAAQLLWRARPYSDALPSNHPDSALIWNGLGCVAYHVGCYDVAARSTSRARRIRENTIGENTVETATTYNNLACCLAALDRSLEAQAFLELAAELLKVLLGEDHPRAQTALRNLEKARSYDKHLKCEVPYLFGIPVKDRFRLSGKRLTRRKKKSKDGKSDGGKAGGREGSRKSVASRASVVSTGSKKSKGSSKKRKSRKSVK